MPNRFKIIEPFPFSNKLVDYSRMVCINFKQMDITRAHLDELPKDNDSNDDVESRKRRRGVYTRQYS